MDNGHCANGHAGEHREGAGGLLQELATCLDRMMGLLQMTVGMIRPTSASMPPTVTATLSGIVQATEQRRSKSSTRPRPCSRTSSSS